MSTLARERVDSVEPVYLTALGVAELLQVDVKTVYRWAATDASMPATRIAGVVRFHRERLLAWLEGRTQGSRARLRHIRPGAV